MRRCGWEMKVRLRVPDQMIIEVGMDFDFALAPDALKTVGAGPCIVVAILNETQGEAGLLHTPGAQATGDLDSFLAAFARSEGDSILVLITGGDTSVDRNGADVRGDRKYVQRRVQDAFPEAKIAVRWIYRRSCNVVVTTDPPSITREVELLPYY